MVLHACAMRNQVDMQISGLVQCCRNMQGDELLEVFERGAHEDWFQIAALDYPHDTANHCCRFSPNSSRIAVCVTSKVRIHGIHGELEAVLDVVQSESHNAIVPTMEWSASGMHVACWCTLLPAIQVFECDLWARTATIAFPGFAHMSMGLAFGITDLVHIFVTESSVQQMGLSLSRLHETALHSVSMPAHAPFDFPAASAAPFVHIRPLQGSGLPPANADGMFMAVVEQDQLHIIHARSRAIVSSHPLNLPRFPNGLAGCPVTHHTEQVLWLPSSSAIIVTTSFEVRLLPFLCRINIIHC